MINVQAAGGVVYRDVDGERRVLLIFRNGVWDLPKGKKESDETIEECARREIAEETGIPSPVIEHYLVKTHHQYKRQGQIYSKETHWFAMKTDEDVSLDPQRAEGITKVAWMKITKAKQKVGYQNLQKVLNSL